MKARTIDANNKPVEMSATIEKMKKRITDLEKKIKGQDDQLKELTSLNLELQNAVINAVKEHIQSINEIVQQKIVNEVQDLKSKWIRVMLIFYHFLFYVTAVMESI